MEDRNAVLTTIEEHVDFERIERLSVPEKFKLVNFIGLLHKEANYANQVGLLKLDQSPNYGLNKTYKLYAMLVSNGTKFEMLKRIISNYARNFDTSDVYYAQTVIIGVGLMMIDKGFEPNTIHNYLMHLLGKEFLIENQKYSGLVEVDDKTPIDVTREIEYKPFEGNMRKIKYDILALIIYMHENSLEKTVMLVNEKFEHDDLSFYLNMLNIPCPETRKHVFENFDLAESRAQRLKLNGAYALINKYDLFTAHYLFNSIIGKYSRYEKDSKEIENEAKANLQAILA